MSGGLGLRHHFDIRSMRYRMSDVLRASLGTVPEYRLWEHGEILDQGREGACVGFGWAAWHNCKPRGFRSQVGNAYGFGWYEEAKKVDPWPGEAYEGTSVGAGAKVAQTRGLLDTYIWADGLSAVDAWLLAFGPIVIGSDWLHSMDDPNRDGFLSVNLESGVRGGHCWLLYGKDRDGNYHAQNSWGEAYGVDGTFRLWPGGLRKLISGGNLVACTSAQVGVA